MFMKRKKIRDYEMGTWLVLNTLKCPSGICNGANKAATLLGFAALLMKSKGSEFVDAFLVLLACKQVMVANFVSAKMISPQAPSPPQPAASLMWNDMCTVDGSAGVDKLAALENGVQAVLFVKQCLVDTAGDGSIDPGGDATDPVTPSRLFFMCSIICSLFWLIERLCMCWCYECAPVGNI